MKYSNVVQILYGTNRHLIIDLLNDSVYTTKHNPVKQSTVISTGFGCKIQTDKFFEFLYDFDNEILIRQPRPDQMYPLINGLAFQKGIDFYKGFYFQFYQFIVSGVQKNNNERISHYVPLYTSVCSSDLDIKSVEVKSNGKTVLYENFFVFDDNGTVIEKYPIQRIFEKLYLGNETFDFLKKDYL